MPAPLASIFEESIEQVHAREHIALQDLLNRRDGTVVLFGSGTLGRRALPLLRQIGATVVAFSDNNSAAWGKQIENVPILSPADAASRYGDSAVFIVTIWNAGHWFKETYDKLIGLGCTLVSTYAPVFWRFPNEFLNTILLNEPAHCLYQDAPSVLEAEKIWNDQESLETYRGNILWRALGNGLEMPTRPPINTYFPRDLFRMRSSDVIVDCGAFDGDTIRLAIDSCPDGFETIHAIEADDVSFLRLKAFCTTLHPAIQERLRLHKYAVGAERAFVRFDSDGSMSSRVSESGSEVEMIPIDQLFVDTPVTFIKMDIEGAEYDTLRGARQVLTRDQPILAICVYHTQNDIWRLPLMIREVLPNHLLYLRGYEGDGFQTVLYAVPPERLVS